MVGKLDKEIIEKFKEFQRKTGEYSDLVVEDIVFISKKVENIFDIVRRGASPRPIKKFIVNNQYPNKKYNWLKISDVTSSNIYLRQTSQYINEDGKNKSVLGKKGDFLVTNSMTVGIPIILDIDTCFHDGFLYLGFHNRKQKKFYNLYLYYFFTSFKEQLILKSKDGIVKNLNTDIMKEVQIPIPKDLNNSYSSYKIQEAIVDFLEYSFKNIEQMRKKTDERYSVFKQLKESLIPSTFIKDYVKIAFGRYAKEKGIGFNITDVEFDISYFDKYLSIQKGKSKYTSKYIKNNKGEFPVYSSNTNSKTKGLMGKINSYDYDEKSIQFTANGEKAGTIFKLDKHKFSMNGDRGMFVLKENIIYLDYIYYNIKNEFLKYNFSWANKPTNTKIREKIKIFIPKDLKNYTSLEIQKIIADFIEYTENRIQKEFDKMDRCYNNLELLYDTYLGRTFRLIDWGGNSE